MFKLFWYKVFFHWKLILLNFLMDSVLIIVRVLFSLRCIRSIRCIALSILQTLMKFLFNHLKKHMFTWTSSKGHDLWFVIGGFRSVLFVSVFQGLLLVIVPFRATVVSLLGKFFWAVLFLSLARIKQCLPPSLDKNSTHHRDFLCHWFSVLFLCTKLGKRVQTLWFALTSPSLKRLTEQKNPKSPRSLHNAQCDTTNLAVTEHKWS